METRYITITLPKKKEKKRSEFNRNTFAILLALSAICVGIFYMALPSETLKVKDSSRSMSVVPNEVPVENFKVSSLAYYTPTENENLGETNVSHTEVNEPVRELVQERDTYALKYFEYHDTGYPAGFDNYLGEFKLTFYCACKKCCGKTSDDPGYGITRSGTYVSEGRTIAVDPDIIPLGTQVYIKGLGVFTAEDTGSAIDSHRIDIYLDSHQEAIYCGVENAEIYIEG